jgi:Uma2 family endonuclease
MHGTTQPMGAMPVAKLSVEEYLALDRAAQIPSEYHDGEMFPIAAVALEHSYINLNVGAWLKTQLKGTAYRVAGSPLRVRVSPIKFIIPDLMVVCGRPALTDENQDTITNPKVVIEILSPSTADNDSGEKFRLYRQLPSFEEYLLIFQDRARIEAFRKASSSRWILTIYENLDAVVDIESLGVSRRSPKSMMTSTWPAPLTADLRTSSPS